MAAHELPHSIDERGDMVGLAMMAAAVTFTTGGELYVKCSDPDDVKQSSCISYIIGATEGIQTGVIAGDPEHKAGLVCIPGGTTGQQVVDTVKAFLKDNPKYRPASAAISIFGALRGKWACPEE